LGLTGRSRAYFLMIDIASTASCTLMSLRLLPIFSSTKIGNAGQELNGYLCPHRGPSPEMGETLGIDPSGAALTRMFHKGYIYRIILINFGA